MCSCCWQFFSFFTLSTSFVNIVGRPMKFSGIQLLVMPSSAAQIWAFVVPLENGSALVTSNSAGEWQNKMKPRDVIFIAPCSFTGSKKTLMKVISSQFPISLKIVDLFKIFLSQSSETQQSLDDFPDRRLLIQFFRAWLRMRKVWIRHKCSYIGFLRNIL